MQTYQLTLLIRDSLSEDKRKTLLEGVTKDFDKVVKEDLWGSKPLTYQIEKQDKAFYANYQFEAAPEKVSSLDKKLKLNEDVIRFLLIKRDPAKYAKTAVAAEEKPVEVKEETVKEEVKKEKTK